MPDKFTDVLSQALMVDKKKLSTNSLQEFISVMRRVLIENKKVVEETNRIDQKNQNGFSIDFQIIETILNNVEKESIRYGTVTISKYDANKKLIYGKEYLDAGLVVVCSDGNPYTLIELILRNVLAGNTTIFVNEGYCYGTNHLLVELVNQVLTQLDMPSLIYLWITENAEEVLSNFANINLVVAIGSRNLQNRILAMSKTKCIVSGYENFDLYIEDKSHLDFIEKIREINLPIQFYVKEDLNLEIEDSILVEDIEEAIAQINYNGNHYATSIFTSNENHASKFIKEIKASIVTVNTSPTIEHVLDINQKDLMIEKTVIYPASYNLGIRNIFTEED